MAPMGEDMLLLDIPIAPVIGDMEDDIMLEAAMDDDIEDDDDIAFIFLCFIFGMVDMLLLDDIDMPLPMAPVWAWVRAGIATAPAARATATAMGRNLRIGYPLMM